MALGATYATLPELKAYVGIDDTDDDLKLTDALNTASRGVDKVCHRQFNDAGDPSARVYYPEHSGLVEVDDFHTVTGLLVKVDNDGDGVFETTWSSGEFQLEPLNGIVDGEPGWPWWKIRAAGSLLFPCRTRRAPIEVTARWGWAAVPAGVKQACLIVAEETFKLKDAPFGVAGFGEFGQIRVRENPMAMKKLQPYVREAVLVA